MGPIKEFRDLLARYCLLADINEFNTSKKCSAWCAVHDGQLLPGFCDGLLQQATVKDEQGLPQRPHAVKRCTQCSTVSPPVFTVLLQFDLQGGGATLILEALNS